MQQTCVRCDRPKVTCWPHRDATLAGTNCALFMVLSAGTYCLWRNGYALGDIITPHLELMVAKLVEYRHLVVEQVGCQGLPASSCALPQGATLLHGVAQLLLLRLHLGVPVQGGCCMTAYMLPMSDLVLYACHAQAQGNLLATVDIKKLRMGLMEGYTGIIANSPTCEHAERCLQMSSLASARDFDAEKQLQEAHKFTIYG